MKRCSRCHEELPDNTKFCPYDGTRLEADASAPRDPLIGALIGGRYRVSSRLGQGGTATVYLATHGALKREVALKVLHPELASRKDAIARFGREAQAASRVDHENIVYILDFGVADEGFYFLVMEHVTGRGLEREVEQGPMPMNRAAHILSQIAAGVARAHDLGIVHRDLKPENIRLCQRGSDRDFVKILDFGLSRPMDTAEPAITRTGQLFGTPHYMAPEQWNCQPADQRTDIYAFGVIAYELLTGQLPFDAQNLMGLMRQHLEVAPPSPRAILPSVTEAAERLVLRCLEKRPAARFASFQEVLPALGEIWKDLPHTPRNTTYAATMAAPPRPRTNEPCDATEYQSQDLDVIWDAPSLSDEIERLHLQRQARLSELIEALFGASPPGSVNELRSAISEQERRFSQTVTVIRRLREKLEASSRDGRLAEAELRGRMVEAGVLLAKLDEPRLPDLDDVPDTEVVGVAPYRRPGGDEQLAAARHEVERRLADLDRERVSEQIELHRAFTALIGTLHRIELGLAQPVSRLSELVEREVRAKPELRGYLVAFQKIDGAIGTYLGLLSMLDESS